MVLDDRYLEPVIQQFLMLQQEFPNLPNIVDMCSKITYGMDENCSIINPQDLLIIVPREGMYPTVAYDIESFLGKEADFVFGEFQDAIQNKGVNWKNREEKANLAFEKIAGFSAYDLREAARKKRKELINQK